MITAQLTTIDEILKKLESVKESYYFRGIQDYEYHMKPNIGRCENVLDNECKMLKKLYKEYYSLEKKEISTLELLKLGQHYGLKTRLLDLTTNPYTALFFAIANKEDRDIHIWGIRKDKERIIESKKVRLGDIVDLNLRGIDGLRIESLCEFDIYTPLKVNEVEGKFFEKMYKKLLEENNQYTLLKYRYGENYMQNPRLMVQEGLFILFKDPYTCIPPEELDLHITIKLSVDEKKQLLQSLEKEFNICQKTLLGNDIYTEICQDANKLISPPTT